MALQGETAAAREAQFALKGEKDKLAKDLAASLDEQRHSNEQLVRIARAWPGGLDLC